MDRTALMQQMPMEAFSVGYQRVAPFVYLAIKLPFYIRPALLQDTSRDRGNIDKMEQIHSLQRRRPVCFHV